VLALILLLGFSTAVAIGTDRAPQRRFDTTGGTSFSLPSAVGAAGGGPTTAAVKKHKQQAASPYGNLVTFSTSTPNSTGDPGTTTSDTPRRRTGHQPSNSVGGEENGSTSTPTTGTARRRHPLRRRHPERRHAARHNRAAARPGPGPRPPAATLTGATGEQGESPLHCAAIGR
jgi:hypothetical protein